MWDSGEEPGALGNRWRESAGCARHDGAPPNKGRFGHRGGNDRTTLTRRDYLRAPAVCTLPPDMMARFGFFIHNSTGAAMYTELNVPAMTPITIA